MSLRPTLETRQATPTLEGAGVKLHRAFGFQDPSEMDPFLLFDDFRNELTEDFEKGFPWHPHRGIETITYVLSGTVEHGDSLGNKGTLGAGDVQWMTAGRGIMHQEMPQGNQNGQMHGFQLWGNLPGSLKMTDPRYQDVAGTEIPEVIDDGGTRVKVIVGEFGAKKALWMESPQILSIWIFTCHPACKRPSKLTPTAEPLPMCLTGLQLLLMPLRQPGSCWKKRWPAKRSTFGIYRATAP